MSILTPIPPDTPWLQRLVLSIPVVGWIARDVMFGDRDNILWFAITVASLWLMSVGRWGLAALLVPFTLAVPVALWVGFGAMIWAKKRAAARRAASRAEAIVDAAAPPRAA